MPSVLSQLNFVDLGVKLYRCGQTAPVHRGGSRVGISSILVYASGI